MDPYLTPDVYDDFPEDLDERETWRPPDERIIVQEGVAFIQPGEQITYWRDMIPSKADRRTDPVWNAFIQALIAAHNTGRP